MENLIPIVNKLQEVFTRLGITSPIDLPQITVVGAQSSGKSSVLESICGLHFLPRGTGIVTRRPTIVQLHKLEKPDSSSENEKKDGKEGEGEKRMWIEFLHKPGQKYTDLSLVRQEILEETNRSAGRNKKIKPQPIILKVFSEDVVDLTLVDLPGITRIPIGDQPDDIERLVRALILSYIEKENCIILAVHPANTDLATSDAIQLARSVDPEGRRTLGVITKIDLMDPGTDVVDILENRVFSLRRGYIGVINRSQLDINQDVSHDEVEKNEMKFFKGQVKYRPFIGRVGTKYLAKCLSDMLITHIKECLPMIRTKLYKQLEEAKEEMERLGEVIEDDGMASGILLQSLTRFAGEFSNSIDGKPDVNYTTTELVGGARLNYIFHEIYGQTLYKMNPFQELSTEDIRTAIRNASGHRNALFISESAFELLIRKQIKRFQGPALNCVDFVYEDLLRLVENLQENELARFKKLKDAVNKTTLTLLKRRKAPTIEMVKNLIEMESNYINTKHPDFIGGTRALSWVLRSSAAAAGGGGEMDGPMNSGGGKTGMIPNGIHRGPNHLHQKSGDLWLENEFLGRARGNNPNPTSDHHHHQHQRSSSQAGLNSTSRLIQRSTLSSNRPPPYSSSSHRDNPGSKNTFSSLSVPTHLRIGSSEPVGETEQQELEIIKMLIESYFDIVRIRLQDMVPKAIMTFLVNKSRENLQSALVTKLYKPEMFKELMTEEEEMVEKRKENKELREMLERAVEVVNQVRDIR